MCIRDSIGGDIVLEIQKGSVFERIGIDHLKDGNGTFGFIDPNPRLYYLRAATREESEVNSLATGVIVYWYKTGY